MMQNAGNSLQYLSATKTDIGAKVGKTCLLITIFKENVGTQRLATFRDWTLSGIGNPPIL